MSFAIHAIILHLSEWSYTNTHQISTTTAKIEYNMILLVIICLFPLHAKERGKFKRFTSSDDESLR